MMNKGVIKYTLDPVLFFKLLDVSYSQCLCLSIFCVPSCMKRFELDLFEKRFLICPLQLFHLRQVIFVGEEAVDAGGVRKEFFLLIMKELLDPKYGMFRYYEESRLIWFSNKVNHLQLCSSALPKSLPQLKYMYVLKFDGHVRYAHWLSLPCSCRLLRTTTCFTSSGSSVVSPYTILPLWSSTSPWRFTKSS